MEYVKKEKDLEWTPHPFLPIQIKLLLTQKSDGAEITCFLVKIPVGRDIPEHVHETQEDILFLLSGKGKMWIDGLGDFSVEKGAFIRVPKNTKHRIYEVAEEIINYDVFAPALF
jgi:quercetin dioxygenase-like cupin family protein